MLFDDQTEAVRLVLPAKDDNHRPSVRQHPIYAILSQRQVEGVATLTSESRELA
jgi:hypothetical protein